jgi:hypothetical protein
MIQAMVCSLVFISGAGTSRSGIAPGEAFEFAFRQHVRIADNAAFAAAERDVHHRAFPCHPRGQRADLVEIHVGSITNAAFGGTTRDGMLHTITGEHLDASVIEPNRDVHGEFESGAAEHLLQTFVEAEPAGRLVESCRRSQPWIDFVRQRRGRFHNHG